MKLSGQLFIFTIEGQRFGLDLEVVQRIERAAEITKVPESPALISGIIDYHGKIVPVFDLRKKLKLPDKELSAEMRFLLIRTESKHLIIVADVVEGVINVPAEVIMPGTEIDKDLIQAAIVRLADGVIFIYDVEKFLSAEEETELKKVLGNYKRQSPSP
ncbi:MAG: chemotaxis protein CheW [Bacteroidales bacterium]|nr:chemotaxis protein CheW [Bacteroidales bacterium]